jgi:hypothetical protein
MFQPSSSPTLFVPSPESSLSPTTHARPRNTPVDASFTCFRLHSAPLASLTGSALTVAAALAKQEVGARTGAGAGAGAEAAAAAAAVQTHTLPPSPPVLMSVAAAGHVPSPICMRAYIKISGQSPLTMATKP